MLMGFPVRIHPMFWLSALLLGCSLKEPVLVLIWVVAMVLCILLHEFGHAIVMQRYGFRPSIVLYSFGGLTIPHPGPDGARRPGPWGEMLISIAGPASGFLLADVLALGLYYLGYPVMVFEPTWRDAVPVVVVPNRFLYVFLNLTFEIAVNWGLLNLLPIYPLDGGQIAQQVFVLTNPHNRQDAIRQSLILSVIIGGMMGVIAFMQWHNTFLAILFAWLTYSNFTMLQSFHGHGGSY